MNSWLYIQFLKYRKFLESLTPHKRGIILYTSLSSFLITLFIKIMRKGKDRKKSFTKNQKKNLLKSKLFFKSVYTNKIKLEFTGNDGIKYTKAQLFLSKIYENSKNKNNNKEKRVKNGRDKAFFTILNKYIDSN